MPGRAMRHRIVTVLHHGMTALEPAVAHDFFGVDRSYLGVQWYRYSLCADDSPLRVGGLSISVPDGFEALERADTIVVPGWPTGDTSLPQGLLDGLRRARRRGARIVSFCTGALVLAEAGLLEGRPATTHWAFCPEFRRRYPNVRLDPSVLYVDDGQILTSAGVAASIDLSLHLIRSDFGAQIANAVARSMVVAPHRDGGQAQFIETPVNTSPRQRDDPLSTTLNWAAAHLNEPLTVEHLAQRAILSVRQYSRRFKARTGTTPHQWVLNQRTTLAQRLLETTDTPIEQVATESGFTTTAALRLHFQRRLHTSPRAYRRAFRDRGTP